MTDQTATNKGIYLDYAATTPVAPPVVDAMAACLGSTGNFGNPASQGHLWGHNAREAVEQARAQVASLLNASAAEIVWTSGATEANNLAIKGAVESTGKIDGHVITSSIEHPAVLDTFKYLETKGCNVSYLDPDDAGVIHADAVLNALREDTVLVSLMHVNNEIGTQTDIEAIGRITRPRKILFHVDATQSIARLRVDVRKAQVDLLALSGHKIYAPKGIGALFVCRQPKASISAQIHGGGHEQGLRSGTLPTHQIVGLGEATRLIGEHFDDYAKHAEQLSKLVFDAVGRWPGARINGSRKDRVDGIVNVTIEGVDASALMAHLPHIAVSSGSACTSADPQPSHVLTGMGLTASQCDSTIRLSLGRFTTEAELNRAMADIADAIEQLHLLSPTR